MKFGINPDYVNLEGLNHVCINRIKTSPRGRNRTISDLLIKNLTLYGDGLYSVLQIGTTRCGYNSHGMNKFSETMLDNNVLQKGNRYL